MKWMILFTIGSVQDFIISSRKTRDLQNASQMLSTLISRAMEEVGRYKGEIILPYMEKGKNSNDRLLCPNYFIATYENEQPFGQTVKELVINDFTKAFFDELKKHNIDYSLVNEQLRQQLRSALDLYWCDVPIMEEDTTNETLKKLYGYLEAIKNTKNFEQLIESEGEKCTLCGIRNGIFYNKKEPYKIQKLYTYKAKTSIKGNSIYPVLDQVKALQPCYRYRADDFEAKPLAIDLSKIDTLQMDLKEGECLCGVCLNKRFKENELTQEQNSQEILSLSGFAIKDWLEQIDQDKVISLQRKAETDIYEDIHKYMEKGNKSENEGQEISAPPTYYCLYRMDFDSIGKRLRKENDPTQLSGRIYHFLKNFTESVAKEFKNVRIVYAGGDDLLALMSVQASLDFAIKLKKLFKDTFHNNYSDLTYSQGLFYAHYKSPFTDIIRLSKEKLETVKQRFKQDGKNGTVISLLTDGFSDQDVFFKNTGALNIEKIKCVLSHFTQYSSYFHFALGQSFNGLEEAVKQDRSLFSRMFFAEQNRLMKRSLKREEALSELEALEDLIHEFYYDNCIQKDSIDLTNYFNLFSIIKKLNSQIAEVSTCESCHEDA